jgi:hypothetical protein
MHQKKREKEGKTRGNKIFFEGVRDFQIATPSEQQEQRYSRGI